MRDPSDAALLHAIDERGENLTSWESDRLEEWLRRVEDDAGKVVGTLTPAQRSKAEQIYRERVLGEGRR